MRRALCCAFVAAGVALVAASQDAKSYVEDPDPLVRQRISEWQDLKLGLLMHWGPYAQWGIVESWSLCSEDEPWCRRSMDDYATYKTAYEKLQTTFNPVRFDPDRWAKAASDAGMRYVVFTTKHHDGFSMFDTRETDYRITSPKTPFSADPRADVTKGIFDAFRAQGFKVGAYFSKPDWHSPDYWWPYFATPDRNPNYDIKKYTERWARFVAFTHAQIDELMSRYGRVDILWLDGGWVRPRTDAEIKAEINRPDYKFTRVQSQDIDMPRLVAAARARQPGLIVVDREVPGPFQNYLTPEARVPPAPLPYPWEVPMPMARSWSYVPNDVYKSPRVLIQMLVDVVAKGGNLLLNIGPGPDGAWHDAAYDRLAALGAWMKVNSDAIYGTRPMAPYADGQVRFTRGKDGTIFAIYLPRADETALPRELTIANAAPPAGAVVTLVGTGRTIPWNRSGSGFVAHVPADLAPPNAHAWVFRVQAPQDTRSADTRDADRQSARARVDALIEKFKKVTPADSALAAELRALREDDQRHRTEGLRLWNDKGVDSPEAKAVWDKQSALDAKNQARLEAIVTERGWPGVRLAGLAGADAAFLIVDHAPLAFQKRCLPLLQAAVDAQDAVPMWAAMLDDRVRVNEGRPQRYGTQVHKEAGWKEWRLYEIEDEARVDDRRAAAGFEPLAEYLKQFGISYKPPRKP